MNRVMLLGCSLLVGCSTPDLQLAKDAKFRGDTETAEANFRPLAELGYVDAQVGLADLLIKSPSKEKQAKGEQMYREAMDKSPLAPTRLGKWLASKPDSSAQERNEADQLLRRGLQLGDTSTVLPWVRVKLNGPQGAQDPEIERQLDLWEGQGIAEAQLGKILLYRARGDYQQHVAEIEQTCQRWLAQVTECYAELAVVYRSQGRGDEQAALLERMQSEFQSGRLPPETMRDVAKALVGSDAGQPDPEAAKGLYVAITPTFPDAWCDLAELSIRYPQLVESSEEIQAYLQKGLDAGINRAAYMLGRLYLRGKVIPADPVAAEKYLLMSAPLEPKAHYFLGKLYAGGQLGQIQPEKALEHYLIAARAGDVQSDIDLARLFSDGQGVKINKVYAYSFANLAKQAGLPYGQVLIDRLAPSMNSAEIAKALELSQGEMRARGDEQVSATLKTNSTQGML